MLFRSRATSVPCSDVSNGVQFMFGDKCDLRREKCVFICPGTPSPGTPSNQGNMTTNICSDCLEERMDCVEERPASAVNANISEQRSDEGKDEATTLTVRRPLRRQRFRAPRSTMRVPRCNPLRPSSAVRLRDGNIVAGVAPLPRRTARSFDPHLKKGHRRRVC